MKVNLVRILFLAILAVLVMTGCATTPEKKMSAEDRALCAALDSNHDGKITKEEFMARTNDKEKGLQVFEKCDTGHKGHLTYNEVINQRWMLPPELTVTTPPVLMPRR
jgi:Ca2+-binding EF-hand superfamily protein